MNANATTVAPSTSKLRSAFIMSGFAAMTAAAMVVASAAEGNGAELVSHRAFYTIELGSASAASGMAGLKGGEVYSFTNSCDGWVVEVNTMIAYQYNEGGSVKSGWNFSAWESMDGLNYRFTARRTRNGKVVKDIRGRARLDKVGGKGIANFSAPEEREIELPAGSIFPTRHMIDLIDNAAAGQRGFIGVLFDGASLDNPFEVNTVIGPSQGRKSLDIEGGNDLSASPSWLARLAYFPVVGEDAEPEVELAIDIRDDGVASRFEQDFGDYSIIGTLQKVEPFAQPDC